MRLLDVGACAWRCAGSRIAERKTTRWRTGGVTCVREYVFLFMSSIILPSQTRYTAHMFYSYIFYTANVSIASLSTGGSKAKSAHEGAGIAFSF